MLSDCGHTLADESPTLATSSCPCGQLTNNGRLSSSLYVSIDARLILDAYGGASVKVIPRHDQPQSQKLRSANPSSPDPSHETYFFCEQSTGALHFHVGAGSDGQFPVEEAASLLAMHCMFGGQSPRDYAVMVEAAHKSLGSLTEKAEKLLQAGHSVRSSVKLTRRQEEVYGGVMRSLANKEIAAALNLSERTVKFHVSSLLTKFHVRGRLELRSEPTQCMQPMIERNR